MSMEHGQADAQAAPTPGREPAVLEDGQLAEHLRGHDVAFLSFIENWLENRGIKEPGSISPLLTDWLNQNKQDDGNVRRSDLQDSAGSSVNSGVNNGEAEARRRSEGLAARGPGDQATLVRIVADDIISKLKYLNDISETNYLLLLAPPFATAPTDGFPHLSTSDKAVDYWHSLRGGPATNLAKFLALSVPTTTTKRLAMPAGDRSLDVKARLNMVMRRMVREVSGRDDAEMKWTKPESLITNYGVKIIGWPGLNDGFERRESQPPTVHGHNGEPGSIETQTEVRAGSAQPGPDGGSAVIADGITLADGTGATTTATEDATAAVLAAAAAAEAEQGKGPVSSRHSSAEAEAALIKVDTSAEYNEPIPLRNPSNNSVVQNKRLLALLESGALRIVPATAADRVQAETQRPRPRNAPSHDAPGGGDDDDIDPALLSHRRNGNGDEDDYSPEGHSSMRKRKAIGSQTGGASKRTRSKPEMTIQPDGTVRQGGLEGRKRPGRPRKSVPQTTEESEDPTQHHGDAHADAYEALQNLRNDELEHARGAAPRGLVDLLPSEEAYPGALESQLEVAQAIASVDYRYKYDEADVGSARTLAAMGSMGSMSSYARRGTGPTDSAGFPE